MSRRSAYVCGPLPELPSEHQITMRILYAAIADVFKEVAGVRAFVSHEHFDPVAHANDKSSEIHVAKQDQICNETYLVVVVAKAPFSGHDIEVEMARQSGIPAIIVGEREELRAQEIFRLRHSNPAVVDVIPYDSLDDLRQKLRAKIRFMFTFPGAMA